MEKRTIFIIGIIATVGISLIVLGFILFDSQGTDPDVVSSEFPRTSSVRSIAPDPVSQETEAYQLVGEESTVTESESSAAAVFPQTTIELQSEGVTSLFETVFQPQQSEAALSIQQVFTTIQTDIGPELVFNFLQNPGVYQQPGGYYSFDGPLGSPIPTQDGTTGEIIYLAPNPIYTVSYTPETSHFSIVLIESPFETARAMATADLQRKLGITQAALCVLHTSVAVPRFADPLLSGIELGIPGCSGAYQL